MFIVKKKKNEVEISLSLCPSSNRRDWLIGASLVLVGLLILSGLIFRTVFVSKGKNQLKPAIQANPPKKVPVKEQGECRLLSASRQSHPLNILFFADEYENEQEFGRDMELIMEAMHTTQPFSEFDNYQYYQLVGDPSICWRETENALNPHLKCDGDRLKALISMCPGEGKVKVVVLSREQFVSHAGISRGESSIIYLSTVDQPDEKVKGEFLHEFGHAFGLLDEFANVHTADKKARSHGRPNCAYNKDVAREWWGDLIGKVEGVGYYYGCAGSKTWLKPTENSIMGTQDYKPPPGSKYGPYGPVNERFLRDVMACCFAPEDPRRSGQCQSFYRANPEYSSCWLPTHTPATPPPTAEQRAHA